MGSFDLDGGALWLNRLAMTGLAVVLAAVALRCFTRVERDSARTLRRLAPRKLLGAALRLAPFALLPVVAGSILALQIQRGFQGDAARRADQEYRRRNVATWSGFQPATLTEVDLSIDLEPRRRHMAVDGTFTLVNRSDAAMRRLPFTVGQAFEQLSWTVDGAAVGFEDRSGLHLLRPASPLGPGDRVRVGFSYRATFPQGPTRNGGGVSEFILPSGVALHSLGPNLLPIPGFVARIGVDGDRRAEPAEVPDDFWRAELKPVGGIPEPFDTRVEVTAPSAYTVNSVGLKTAERHRDGRTTVVWESDHPVKALNIVAGRWDVRRREATAVFYHPGHPYNVDEISDTLVAARRRYSEWFHPYPWKQLRVNEFPDYVTGAKGFPTNIPFSEGIGFLAAGDPELPLAFLVTAHETAHQWWGNLLTPGEGPGADVLIEGMANYSTLLLLESEKGLRGRIGFARRLERLYAGERRVDAERPLAETAGDGRPGERTVIYDKGAWVLWMLHNHLGRQKALAGLREFFGRYVDNPDHPAIHDLLATLRPWADDPAAYREFVDQWFFDVVVPEYRIRAAAVSRCAEGWNVSATLENVGSGTATVELAAIRGERFRKRSGEAAPGYEDERLSVRLAPGKPRQLSWIVSFEPQRLVVDPDLLVLQLNRDRATAEL